MLSFAQRPDHKTLKWRLTQPCHPPQGPTIPQPQMANQQVTNSTSVCRLASDSSITHTAALHVVQQSPQIPSPAQPGPTNSSSSSSSSSSSRQTPPRLAPAVDRMQ
ncbi:hypothetical protein LTR54_003604 [Friedmanniomyces endolithicus]|nr:hypothetical protein LTR54_003604 [Friedmanniomyces endolithicus]